MDLLLCGIPERFHVGAHLLAASRVLGLSTEMVDANAAYRAPALTVKYNWWLRGRRPAQIRAFSRELLQKCRHLRPRWLLTTGVAPIDAAVLREIGDLGVRRVNYSTDDPWNPAHRAPWFLDGLAFYDHVFTPRRANMEEFSRAGCSHVSYAPFAYNPEVHFWEHPALGRAEDRHDVVFVGGGDRDRLPWMTALLREGLDVGLYGGYWDRYAETKSCAKGLADEKRIRQTTTASKVSVCLVRRANRDGHCMRSFEIAACGGCMLVEDTADHRDLFGEDGEAVRYFSTVPELVAKARALLGDEAERERLRRAAHRLVVSGGHTYTDRLRTMMATVLTEAAAF